MKEIIVSKNQSEQRLNKFLMKYLNKAPSSFIYKMLRKKNIKLNDKKADGNEIIHEGDKIKLFLSDETISNFQNSINEKINNLNNKNIKIDILYQSDDIIAVNKPVGILSQKADKKDYSINEAIIDYLKVNNIITEEEMATFKPSICNRLDRNTSGIIFAGITLKGSQELTKAFKERVIEKYYYTIVSGRFLKELSCDGYISRDENKFSSKVITDDEYSKIIEVEKKNNYSRIETKFYPISIGKDFTLLKIKLITGKTHQIRAHLKSLGYYVVGDVKYGDQKVNSYMKEKYNLKNHLLHAGEAVWKEKNINIITKLPKQFKSICEGEKLEWQHGILED